MSILVTGFEPFDGSPINPSEQAARALEGEVFGSHTVVSEVLPVDRERGPACLVEALRRVRPAAVVCLGLASGRVSLGVEWIAINLLDFRIPDNAGVQVMDQPVVLGGPDAYFATLPVRSMVEAIRAAGVPADHSLSAGAFLCNQVMYTLLHTAAEERLEMPGGFIHLPALPEQAATSPAALPSMDLAIILRGLRAALAALGSHLNHD